MLYYARSCRWPPRWPGGSDSPNSACPIRTAERGPPSPPSRPSSATLWVLALGEEFFFRGLLQQWMTAWLRSEWAGLLVASLVFGAAHLWYRQFPNWRISAIAALLGLCCGLAFRNARSIRAPMVTHALVVTTWRIFFA